LLEWPSGDEHPPGDTSRYDSILGFYGFLAIFDRWKGCVNHQLVKRRRLIVKLQCGMRELSDNGYIEILGLAYLGVFMNRV